MSNESLKRLVECEKSAGASVENAKREYNMMKSKALTDAKVVVDKLAKEYEQKLANEEKCMQMDVQSEMCRIEEETQKKIEVIRSKTPNLAEVAEQIVRKIASINKVAKTSL